MADKVIHLVFKTHLDIGFTDHAEKVRRQYHERFIPQAIETGEHFFNEDPIHPRFIWTTGAWLIWDHLEHAGKAAAERLERAIERGLIRWHALPFTTHSELMSPDLFRAGLSYSQELDRRFSRRTIAAKMTDVPGHSMGIVPLLAEAGVRFLHLGVNTASPVPDVPDVFRWRTLTGEEVVVMYESSYGATRFPQGLEHGLSFAHTDDNAGPQSVPRTVEIYRHLQARHPDAEIRAATLEDYAALLWAERQRFPVVDIEIGDSWIHGIGSDPIKTARFLALQRLYDRFARDTITPERLAFGRGLAMVAEHTWGVDIKTYLRDETSWDRPAFEAARLSDPRFAFTEASWTEQRRYLDTATAKLNEADRSMAVDTLASLEPMPNEVPIAPVDSPVELDGWMIVINDESGDIVRLVSPGGIAIDGLGGSLLGYRYESYDAGDVAKHLGTYLQHKLDWAILDHDKPGLSRARSARSACWAPRLTGIAFDRDTLRIRADLPRRANEELGAPEQIELVVRPTGSLALDLSLIMWRKPANRMPEASFVTFTPAGAGNWDYCKMGRWQKANRIAPRGGGQLQAVTAVRTRLGDGPAIELTALDTPLVAPADTPFMPFAPSPPSLAAGIRFNLHNNKWGTNFPMWWSGNFHARFALRIGAEAG